MRRWFLKLSFKGSFYAGWQRQENAQTVQGEVDRALGILLKSPVTTTGCGRTDTGVHATMFFAHFDLAGNQGLGMMENQFVKSINAILDAAILVHEIFEVDPSFHARFSALSRTYEYRIAARRIPFLSGLVTVMHSLPDTSTLNESCRVLLGEHDFTSFSKSHTQTKTNICTLMEADWTIQNELTFFTITADRFLRGMVRAIVGTCLNGCSPSEMLRVLHTRNRSAAGPSAPAEGLFLTSIRYPDELISFAK
ncbi:MAG: tRNA pseudouridine(38-40) synthase TruA [Bacteroidota bacterium]